MLTFRQFLKETPWINSFELDTDSNKEKLQRSPRHPQDIEISRLPSNHIITKKKIDYYDPEEGYYQYEYSAIGPDGKKDLSLKGHQKGNSFIVVDLSANKDNTLKAHELYHHLITKHNLHIHSDYEQSTGGMKTWKKLHKMPGIHMQSYNGSTNKYSELKPSFQRVYDMDSSTRLAAKKR